MAGEGDGMNGSDVLILLNVGTDADPDYVVLGSQRNCTIAETTAEIDRSSKESRAMRVLPGRYGSTITLDALYVPDDEAYLELQSADRNGTFVVVRVSEDGVETEEADAIVTNLTRTAPDQDVATVSCTLRIDGEWAAVGS